MLPCFVGTAAADRGARRIAFGDVLRALRQAAGDAMRGAEKWDR